MEASRGRVRGRGRGSALTAWALAAGLAFHASPSGGYERIQTHGRRIWIGPGDLLTLTDPERDRVAVYDVSSERPRKLGEFGEQGSDPWQLLGPHGAVLTGAGELVVADSFNHRVQAFDAAALRAGMRPALLRVFGEAGGYAGGLDAPMALATRPGSARVYVADTRNHRVLEFEGDGRATGLVMGRAGKAPGELGWPSALAFDTDGRTLYVAEQWNARVSAFDADSGRFLFSTAASVGGTEPGPGMVGGLVRVGGALLVTDQAGQRVVRLRIERDPEGRPLALRATGGWGRAGSGPGELQYPQSIAADARGRVYVCDRVGARCQVFTDDGRFLWPLGDVWEPPEWTAPAPPAEPDRPGGHELQDPGGAVVLRVRSEPEPIPLNEPFALVVERGPGAPPFEALRVDAVMPVHRHGMNTQTRVQPEGEGRYRVSGLIFHMAGHWEIHFDARRRGVWERRQLDVEVDGGAGLTAGEASLLERHSPVPALPPDETNKVADDPRAARLGQALFFDARLSPGARVSCASCHDPARSWTDGRSLSRGAGTGTRNTLSLWNVGYNRWYFWDGRADALWSQALKPMESRTEMGGSRLAVARLVCTDKALRAAYSALFGPPPDVAARGFPEAGGPASADAAGREAWERLPAEDRAAVNQVFVDVGKAIAAFERRLVSRRAPFDVFVEGLREDDPSKVEALSESARRGARLFVGRGQCAVCHAGPLFTDGEFHDIGVPPNAAVSLPDIGRLAGIEALLADELGATGPWSDDRNGPRAALVRHLAPRPEVAGQLKTPSLRNVATTAPYMHEGQLQTLRDVLGYYSTLEGRRGLPAQQERILAPLHLSEQEVEDLVAFLESLTDTAVEPSLLGPPKTP